MSNTANRRNRRRFLFEMQRGRCHWCGCKMKLEVGEPHKKLPTFACTIDHIVPRGKGGCNQLHNLVAACNGCNQRRNNAEQKGQRGHDDYAVNMPFSEQRKNL